ncbi:MAG TPA: DUF1670 domain-containing protein [Acidimicrobiales bacterium]|nr:DUF1670 domain-containing protein [Acidimicrobiales bacterium]
MGHGCLRNGSAGGEGRRVGDRCSHLRGLQSHAGAGACPLRADGRYFADYGHVALRPGELCYLAVASEEPPGKPIVACRKVQVALELAAPEDLEVLRTGLAAMRQQRLARLARQAQVQGGLLTVEDLAFLTCSSPATVKRDLAECRVNDIAVPTRGQIRDIGPGVSHKARVVQLYLPRLTVVSQGKTLTRAQRHGA